ncbi:MAG: hypothetical protein ACREIM_10605 [Nitrospiraceae bacterium]
MRASTPTADTPLRRAGPLLSGQAGGLAVSLPFATMMLLIRRGAARDTAGSRDTARSPLAGVRKRKTLGAHQLAPVHKLDVHILHVVNLIILRVADLVWRLNGFAMNPHE